MYLIKRNLLNTVLRMASNGSRFSKNSTLTMMLNGLQTILTLITGNILLAK